MRSENNKILEEGIKKFGEENVVKKDSLLSLTIFVDFFQIAVYLNLFVLNGISCLLPIPIRIPIHTDVLMSLVFVVYLCIS